MPGGSDDPGPAGVLEHYRTVVGGSSHEQVEGDADEEVLMAGRVSRPAA